MRSLSFIVVCIVLVSNVWGQDTTRRAVRVTSSFKPVLKDAAKINFNASPPNVDTTRPRLQYDIPNQNLLFAYQPGTLRPLALSVDTGGYWDSWNYAKLGYGSLNTPYFETGLSLGDGKTAGLNIYGRHISSTGKIDFQKNRNTSVELNGFIKAGNNIELNGRFRGEQSLYNKYGFEPKGLIPNEDSLKVDLQNVGIRLGFHNIDRGKYGLSYAPSFEVDLFSDRMNNRETNAYFKLPLKKTIAGRFEADLAFEGNVTSYSPDDKKTLKNNWFSLAPAVLVKTENVNLQAGIKPTWDNGEFKLFPNIMAEFSSSDKRITIHGGWIGYIRSNTYRSLATYNPFIWAPAFTSNSSIREFYGGVKGALTDHFNYSVRAGLNKITNQPLFTNDTSAGTDGKSFVVVTESELNALNFIGELGYTAGERFSLRSVLRLNRYSGLSAHEKPWGLLPMEFNTSMRLQILKDLFVKTDLTAFDGAWYQTREDGKGSLQGAVDLSAGLEFAIVKNIKLWVQFNNIFNKEYERWKQYPVYGFNMLGGVVFSFAKNNQ